ncbi:hypothetical protein SK128_014555 [Halocaridina rubra]|uniref:Uncharacterized protein n=1 Tax=Halocaridina rubra TaxID=373956 RepID=A0AAN8XAK4_HALRR
MTSGAETVGRGHRYFITMFVESAKEIYDRNRETYGPGIEEGEKGQEASHFLNRNTYKQVFRTQVHAQEKMPNNPSPEQST